MSQCYAGEGASAPKLPKFVSENAKLTIPFEVFSQRYERGATLVTSNLPFDEWTEILGSERLTGALLDRLTHYVHILEMNGESYRLAQSKSRRWTADAPLHPKPSATQ